MTRAMPHRVPARRRRSAGFSIMEVLVAGTVSVVVLLGLMAFFDSQQRAYAAVNSYAQSQNVTRTAIDLIGRELRMSSFDPTGTAILPLSPGPTCQDVTQGLVLGMQGLIRFQQDLDGDGLLTTAGEDVLYGQVGRQIMRWDISTGGAGVALVTGVPNNGLQFTYFDGAVPPNELVPAGSPPMLNQGQRACVEKVQIRIEAQIDAPHPSMNDLRSVVESGVAIRNRSISKF
jgi:hypothetical protein